MQHIFVEGPDGAGKTTLGQQLSIDLWTFLAHTGGPPRSKDEMEARFDNLINLCRTQKTRGLVFDRCPPICEMVYPRVVGRQAYFPQAYCLQIVSSIAPIVVYCRRPLPAMKQAIVTSHKGHKPKEHTDKVLAQYDNLVLAYDRAMTQVKQKGVEVITYDWAKDDYGALKRRLLVCVA